MEDVDIINSDFIQNLWYKSIEDNHHGSLPHYYEIKKIFDYDLDKTVRTTSINIYNNINTII